MPKRFNDSNGSMYISGGNIIVQGPDEGPNRVLETDTNLTITGVTIIGTECCKKPTVITESKWQNSMVIMLDHIVKGKLKVGDITFEPEKSYKSIVISSDKLETNKRYDVKVNNRTVVSYTQKKGVYARNIAKEKE